LRSDNRDPRPWLRRPRAGGAAIALLLIGCIGAGCGSGETPSVGAMKTAVTKTSTTTAEHAATTAERTATTAPAHRRGGSRLTKSERTLVALAALAAYRHPGTTTNTDAAGAAPASTSRATSALARANKTCKLTLTGREIPVACRLLHTLMDEARHSKALARFLTAAAPRH
jgi:hypothetical protein